jgi:hypothetical protein
VCCTLLQVLWSESRTSRQLRDGRFQITPTMILPLPRASLYISGPRPIRDRRSLPATSSAIRAKPIGEDRPGGLL